MRARSLILLTLFACGGPSAPAEPWDPTLIEEQIPEVLALLRAGDADSALAELDRLQSAGALPEGALHYRALALADAGRLDEALPAFEQELTERPGNGHAHALLAELLIDAGRLQEADEHLVDARAFAPEHAMPQLLSGRLALLLDEDEQAQRFFRNYLLLDPFGRPAAEAHSGLSQIARRRGGADDAVARHHADSATKLGDVHKYISSYRARLAVDPEDAEAAYGIATALLNLYVTMSQDDRLLVEAERFLGHLLSFDPAHARSLFQMGFVRIEQRRFDEALELTVRSLDANPSYSPARLNYAVLLKMLGEEEQAVAEFERVIATTDEPAERVRAHYELALIFNASQDLAERARALPHLRALIAIEPHDPHDAGKLIDEIERALAPVEAPPTGG